MHSSHTNREREFRMKDEAEIEQQFLKGQKTEDLGVYCDLFSAKCGEGQDGGVVSALLAAGLEDGTFDWAVVVRGLGVNAEVVVAKNASDVYLARGTKYVKVNVSAKLKELIKEGKNKIAVVATPCEVKSIRKIQQTPKGQAEITVIGLFCFEAFNPTKLKTQIKSCLDVDLDKCQKTEIRKGKLNITLDEQIYSCKIKDLDQAAERACSFCDDFAARFADVSVGSVGSAVGYSTVIVRSKKGEQLVEKLNLDKLPVDVQEIAKLSKFKRIRAQKNLENLQNVG
jgi:coenzyme F420-reducing hydrogenase beta subunit